MNCPLKILTWMRGETMAENENENENAESSNELEPIEESQTVEIPPEVEQTETARLARRNKLTLRQDATDELAEAGDDPTETHVSDPTRRRDTNTSQLKRIPREETASVDDNSDTVNIKVIKEQKKQFRNMMSSSQTLKIRPDADSQPTPSETEAPSSERSKLTLKVKAPSTMTENIPRGGDAGSTQVTPAPGGTHSPKSTLKIKAPPSASQTQSAAAPGATLKIKAPSPSASQTVQAPSHAAQTVKHDPSKAGHTLKLKKSPQLTQKGPAADTQAAEREQQEAMEQEAAHRKAAPGIFYLLLNCASIALTAVVVYQFWTLMAAELLFFD